MKTSVSLVVGLGLLFVTQGSVLVLNNDFSDDANQMARRIMSKDCNRGQSAMWRRVGNRSTIWRSIHWNQCETEPRGEGERNR